MARHGENIRKRKDGRWEGRYKVFDFVKGKYVYRSVYGRNYEAAKEKLLMARLTAACHDADAVLNREMAGRSTDIGYSSTDRNDSNAVIIRNNHADHVNEYVSRILFSFAAKEWLEDIRGKRKYSTYIKYDGIYKKHLANSIGSYRISIETEVELKAKIYRYLTENVLSGSMQKSIICVANQILAFAGKRYMTYVPILEYLPDKTKKDPVGTFSLEDQIKLLRVIYAKMDRFMAAVLIGLYMGLRLGELCALKWTDIDFSDRTLTINRTVQRIAISGHTNKTVLLETDPKSENSRRTLPLPPDLLKIFYQIGDRQHAFANEKLPYIFGGKHPLDPRTMQYRFKKLLREAGIRTGNFHKLRHTFATNCVENGMDVKVLSEFLGHSDVKITLNHYVHPTMESKRKQICAISDFYGQICGQSK